MHLAGFTIEKYFNIQVHMNVKFIVKIQAVRTTYIVLVM